MPSRGSAGATVYMAYNTTSNTYQTADAGNHTLRFVKDALEATPTNAPTEVDSTNAPGAYAIAWTSAEGTCNVLWIGGKSSTANVIIVPIAVGFENLPVLPTSLLSANSGVNVTQIGGVATSTSAALLGINVVTWEGDAPNRLQSGLVQASIVSGAASSVIGSVGSVTGNVGGSVNSVVTIVTANATQIAGATTGTSLAAGNVNVVNWQGVGPNVLQNGLVQVSILSGAANGNVTSWLGVVPNVLQNGAVQVATVSGATTTVLGNVVGSVGSVTARVTANTDQIAGATVNALISGRVDSIANQLGANTIQASTFNAGALTTSVFASQFLTAALVDTTYLNAVADGLGNRANAIEAGLTPYQAWRLDAAAAGGVTSGAGTTGFHILGAGVATARVSAVTDQSGNRLSVTLTL